MKSLYLLLSLGLLLPVIAEAQNPATQSSTTTPKSTTVNTTSRPSVRPPATRAAESNASAIPTATSPKPNRQQELYDQYHGITKKPTPLPPASEPMPQATRPEPVVASVPEISNTQAASQNAMIRIGVRAGVTYPVYFEKIASLDPAVGFVGGVVAQFGRGTISFQPEVNYSRINTKQISGFGTFNGSADQFVVPLFLKISSGTFDGNRFFLNVGPYGSYLSSSSLNGVKQDIDSNIGRISFGAAAGIGTMLKAGPGHVTIEVRGLYRLGDTVNGFSINSKTILSEGTIGYVFPIGR